MRLFRLIGATALLALLALPSAAKEGPDGATYGLPGARFTVAFPAAPSEEKTEATADRPATVSYRASNDSNLFFASVVAGKAAASGDAAILDNAIAALTSKVPLDEKSESDITVDGVKGKRISGTSAKLRYIGYFFVHAGKVFIIHGVSKPPGDAAATKAGEDFVNSFHIVEK